MWRSRTFQKSNSKKVRSVKGVFRATSSRRKKKTIEKKKKKLPSNLKELSLFHWKICLMDSSQRRAIMRKKKKSKETFSLRDCF